MKFLYKKAVRKFGSRNLNEMTFGSPNPRPSLCPCSTILWSMLL